MSLDLYQSEAVSLPIGSAMIIAGPGSGKTTVLTNRVRYMIKELNIPPDEILVITFTKAAALQMKKRFEEISGDYYPVTFSTFHSLFFSIITDASNNEVSLITPKEKLNILVSVLKERQICFDGVNLSSLLAEQSLFKTKKSGKDDFVSAILEKDVFVKVYSACLKEEKLLGKLDFDDFSIWCEEMLRKENVLRLWKKRYRYCLVDEFQDIGEDQYGILKMLFDDNVFAVGDDDQSIYGFRGAKPSICMNFVKDFNAKVVYLSNNYRSQKDIVDKSVRLISHNKERFDKTPLSRKEGNNKVNICKFDSSKEQYNELLEVLKRNFEENKSNVILLRTNNIPDNLLSLLTKEKIKIRCREKPDILIKNGFVKDIVAYFRLSLKDYTYTNLFRIANKPNRYLSRAFLTECKANELIYDNDFFTFGNLYKASKGKSYLAGNIFKLENNLKKMKEMDSYEALIYIFGVIGYEKYLRESGVKYTDIFERLKIIACENVNREDFVSFCEEVNECLTETQITKEDYKRGNVVEICTLHSSKGLEWDNVYIPDVNEGNIPHKKSDNEFFEEERRLFYVGITRAVNNLWIGCVQNENEKKIPSVFVKELE